MKYQFLLKIRVINRFLEIFSFTDHAEYSAFNFITPKINKLLKRQLILAVNLNYALKQLKRIKNH